MSLLSSFLAVPSLQRMLKVGGIAATTVALAILVYFIWFDGVMATARLLGTVSVMADRLAEKGELVDAEALLRAALAIEEEHVFKVPVLEAQMDEDLRRDFVDVLRKEGRTAEADAVAAGKAQP